MRLRSRPSSASSRSSSAASAASEPAAERPPAVLRINCLQRASVSCLRPYLRINLHMHKPDRPAWQPAHLRFQARGNPRVQWALPPRRCPPPAGARWSRRPAPAGTVAGSQQKKHWSELCMRRRLAHQQQHAMLCSSPEAGAPRPPRLHNGLIALALRRLGGLGLGVVAAGICRDGAGGRSVGELLFEAQPTRPWESQCGFKPAG